LTRDKIDIVAADAVPHGLIHAIRMDAGPAVDTPSQATSPPSSNTIISISAPSNEQRHGPERSWVDSASVKLHTSIVKIGINYLFH